MAIIRNAVQISIYWLTFHVLIDFALVAEKTQQVQVVLLTNFSEMEKKDFYAKFNLFLDNISLNFSLHFKNYTQHSLFQPQFLKRLNAYLVEKRVDIIITKMDGKLLQQIYPLSIINNILLVSSCSSSLILEVDVLPNLICLQPSIFDQIQISFLITNSLKYKQLSIFTTSSLDNRDLQDVIDVVSNRLNFQININKNQCNLNCNSSDILSKLQQLKNLSPHVVLLTKDCCLLETLVQAHVLNMKSSSGWLFITAEHINLDSYNQTECSVLVIKKLLGNISSLEIINEFYLNKSDLYESTDRVNQMMLSFLLIAKHVNQILTNKRSDLLINHLQDTTQQTNDEFNLILLSPQNRTIVGKIINNTIIQLNRKPFSIKPVSHNKSDLFLRIVTIIEKPFIDFNGFKFTGQCVDLLEVLSKTAQFRYEIKLVNDGFYGEFNSTVREGWNGLIGSVINDKADLIVAPLIVTPARLKVIKFLPSFIDVGIKFIYRRENKFRQNYNPFAFLSPFAFSVYISIIVTVVLIAIVLNILSKISPYGNRGHFFHVSEWNNCKMMYLPKSLKYKRKHAERSMGINNSLYFVWASLFWQSPDTVPRSVSQRVLTVAWYLAAVIFVATYTANLVSILSNKENHIHHTDIDSISQLMTYTGFKYGTVPNSAVSSLLRTSKLRFARKLYELMDMEYPPISNSTQALKLVNSDHFAFFWDSLTLEHAERVSNCSLKSVEAPFGRMEYAFAVSMSSPYYDLLTSHLHQLNAKGFIRALQHKYQLGVQSCLDTDVAGERVRQLTVADLAGVFYVMAGSMVLGFIVLVAEWLLTAWNDLNQTSQVNVTTFNEALRARFNRVRMNAVEHWLPGVDRFTRKFSNLRFTTQQEADEILKNRLNRNHFRKRLSLEVEESTDNKRLKSSLSLPSRPY